MTLTKEIISDVLRFAESEHISHSVNLEHLQIHSTDFGGIEQGQPLCILRPDNADTLIKIVNAAIEESWTLTTWGGGRSQSGQALSYNGISLDMSQFNEVEFQGKELIRCEAGASWRNVVEHCHSKGLMPYVMPLNLDLSIGGTLSAGGFGATSFKYGPAIAHVQELEVITGSGEYVTCSQCSHPDIFNASLAGQGRCGVIVAATIKLRRYQNNIQTYYLLYQDLDQLLRDQHQLSSIPSVTYVEGFSTSTIQGLKLTEKGRRPFVHWQYGLHVSFEHDAATNITSHAQDVLSALNYQSLLLAENTSSTEYLSRYDIRFQRMKMMKQWGMHHPWFECFIPFEIAPKLISQFLEILPSYVGDGHRIIYFSGAKTTPLFMHSDSSNVVAFAVLPTAVESDKLPEVMKIIEKLNIILYSNGGKRYLSGWMGRLNEKRLQQHYSQHYQYWRRLKAELDPNSVFQSLLFKQ